MSAGQIHDLGYKRYAGSRRAVATRWRVIMRHQLSTAWKTWWRYKMWLAAAVMATAVATGFLYLASSEMIRMLGGMSGQRIQLADSVLPLSPIWYCKAGFIVSLTIGSTVVSGDLQSGAFTFYFARSLRPRDYVIGKLAGLSILMAFVMAAGPVLLGALRLGLSRDASELIALAPTVPKAIAIGVAGTLTYAAVPLGFSALLENRRHTMALWAAYYIVIGTMAQGLGAVVHPAIAALDLPTALQALSVELFDLRFMNVRNGSPPLWASLGSLAAHVGLAIAAVTWRVRRAHHAGVGGAS